jgi:hypothetical protein
MARYNKQTKLTSRPGTAKFPTQGKDFSTLGRPSNPNTYKSDKFQQSSLGYNPLATGARSALSQDTFQPAGAFNAGASDIGALYDNPDADTGETYYLLAECGDFDSMILITECEDDRIEWITECNI